MQQKVAAAKKNGRKNVLVRVEREGNSRFIALPARDGVTKVTAADYSAARA